MRLKPLRVFKNKFFWFMVIGAVLAYGSVYVSVATMKSTSTNEYCESCHVHPHSTENWKRGAHYRNRSGVVVNCVDCHLPPEGLDYVIEKAKAGARDLYGFYFKDISAIDWEAKSVLEEAVHYTFEESCIRCHQELFPEGMTHKGVDAHMHYRKNRAELRCINCHLTTGHYHEGVDRIQELEEISEAAEEIEWAPLLTELPEGSFADYTDVIPGLGVRFEMVAIEGGEFLMGTPPDEPGRREDEGPQRNVEVSSFWMGKFEVTWREFDAYYSQTVTRGKNEMGLRPDAITGPTPPYGSPDQGWGKGDRPAITMSHYAATKFCEWLSSVTGRKYRLPTEAEWEYAARAGRDGPFPFLEDFEVSWLQRLQLRLFGGSVFEPEILTQYAVYRENSHLRTLPVRTKEPNPWGLYHMFGNVKEFCSDFYSPDILSKYPEGKVVDPTGPESGNEWVVRGGSYRSEAEELRAGSRDYTRTDEWLKTDPQSPKSVWWYSDSRDGGFRIVRELD